MWSTGGGFLLYLAKAQLLLPYLEYFCPPPFLFLSSSFLTILRLIRVSDGGGTLVSGAANHSFGRVAGETPTILNQESFVLKSAAVPIEFLGEDFVSRKLQNQYVLQV